MEMKRTDTFSEKIYEPYESKYGPNHTCKCIDGKITSTGKCVGYCQYMGHPGYLTEKHRIQHECLEKNCFHYVEKLLKKSKQRKRTETENIILAAARKYTSGMEGLKILSVVEVEQDKWYLKYISISKHYSLESIRERLQNDFSCKVSFIRLNYDFDVCVKMIITG